MIKVKTMTEENIFSNDDICNVCIFLIFVLIYVGTLLIMSDHTTNLSLLYQEIHRYEPNPYQW